jgi:type II secretory pathway predicted ATPase ExeA
MLGWRIQESCDMYESFFQFSRRPFASAPQVEQFYPARSIDAARQTLARCIERAEGVGLLVGPSGTGKSLVCRLLAAEFRGQFAVVLLGSGRLSTRRSLLQAILFELGLPYRGMQEGELRLALLDRLANVQQCPGGMLLLVDEAHTLPLRLLEEVRLITNVVLDGQPRVRLALAGSRSLEERLASPKLEAISQRIAARCYLEPLDRDETMAYVRAQLTAVGGGEIFSEDALSAVYHATDGVPRLINQICDHALVLACAGGKRTISAAGVEESWADLQQLPTPFNDPSPEVGPAADTIEFGRLDDDDLSPSRTGATGLRLAGAVDDGQADPERWLDHIEDQLSTLDDDFEPAGTIGPEVELSFPQSPDPFAERFEDEEVVLDRSGVAGLPAWNGSPLVSCREGRVLSALMAPFVGIRPPAPWKPLTTRAPEADSLAPQDAYGEPTESNYDPVLPEEPSAQPAPGVRQRPESTADNIGARERTSEQVATPYNRNDRAVMVVEDDLERGSPLQPARQPKPGPRKYSQLFAQLRQR